jgi:hypothetical protein
LPAVQLFTRILGAHESIGRLGVLDLKDLILQFLLGKRDAQFGRGDGFVELLQFLVGELLLKFPIVPTAIMTGVDGRLVCIVILHVRRKCKSTCH